MNAMWVIIAMLATYRLTRLVTADRITQGLRGWVVDRSEWAGYLVTCDWCLSVWIAPGPAVAVVAYGDVRAVQAVLVGLALSAATGLLSLAERRLDA